MDPQQEILVKLCELMGSAFLRIANMSRFIDTDSLTDERRVELYTELQSIERECQWAADLGKQALQLKEK